MRTTAVKVIFAALAFVYANAAHATLFYNETFSYPNGNLVGQDSWTAHNGGGAKPIQVVNGAINVVQSTGSGEDVNKPTGSTMGAGSKWYAAFDVSVTGTNGAGYFAHFLAGTTVFESRVFITPANTVGNDFTFGLSSTSTLAQTWPTDFTFGTTHRIVVSYDFDSKLNKMWIDPTDESSTSVSTTSATSDPISAFAFRQASPNTSNTQTIDNLAVATTFAEALTPVPEPSAYITAAMGVAGLLGMARFRKSRKLAC